MNALASMKNRRGASRPAAKGLTTSWLLATALPVCFGLVPLQAEAAPDDDEVGGQSATAVPFVTSDTSWTVLTSLSVAYPKTRYCIATCSADALNPLAGPLGTHQYRFRVSLNGQPVAVNNSYERTLEFVNRQLVGIPIMLDLDNSIKEITTTGGPFLALASVDANFIKCEARKFLAATPDLTVDDASLTVSCTDTPLP